MKCPSHQIEATEELHALAGLSVACSERGGRETGISASGENQTITSKLVYLLNVLLKNI
jgi:hypothetical protein